MPELGTFGSVRGVLGDRHPYRDQPVPDRDPPEDEVIPEPETRHRLAADALVLAKSVLGGLHHEYSLAPAST
jgi:hypothetical protein